MSTPDRNLLKVMKGSSVPSTTDIATGERLLILTNNGYKAMTKAAALALFGGNGGGGGSVDHVKWNAQGSEVSQPFGPFFSDELAGAGMQYEDGTLIVPAGAMGADLTSVYLPGILPRDFNTYWFNVSTPHALLSPQAGQILTLNIINVKDPDVALESMLLGGDSLIFQVTTDTWTVESGEVCGVVVEVNGIASTITLRQADKSKVYNIPNGEMDNIAFTFMTMNAAGPGTLELNIHTDSSGPLAAEVTPGAIPLYTTVSVPPTLSNGTWLEITGGESRLGFMPLNTGDLYVYFDTGMIKVPSTSTLAQLDAENHFTKGLFLDTDFANINVLDAHNSNYFFGRSNFGGYDKFKAGTWSGVIAIGATPFANAATGGESIGIGNVFSSMTDTTSNMGIGTGGLNLRNSYFNTLLGSGNAAAANRAMNSVFVGYQVGSVAGYHLEENVVIGSMAMSGFTDPLTPTNDDPVNVTRVRGNVVMGANAWTGGQLGEENVVIGYNALSQTGVDSWPQNSVIIGSSAMKQQSGPSFNNVAIGRQVMEYSTGGSFNTAVGSAAGLTGWGDYNTAIGGNALTSASSGEAVEFRYCTALGFDAMTAMEEAVENSTAVGARAQVTGSNQVQLGDPQTTTYAYGAIQNRSDERDKTAVQDTRLGLEFILGLTPVDYKLDMRDDYVDHASRPTPPEPLRSAPTAPMVGVPDYEIHKANYDAELVIWTRRKEEHDQAQRDYHDAMITWSEKNSISNLVHDGTHTRNRFHHGFIAQQVKALADAMGLDFGGFQNHLLNGGQDVQSLGYEEFIAPIVKAIQELNQRITSPQMIDMVAEAVLRKLREQRQ